MLPKRMTGLWLLGALGLLAARVEAQTAARPNTAIAFSGQWMQANALPLDRDAMQSGSITLGIRRSGWSVDAGFLRIARNLSTVEGGSLSIGRPFHVGMITLVPAINGLAGKAYASADTTGFDWTGPNNTTGHTPRYSYSEGGTFGGGAGLTLEVPIFRAIAANASASQWFFSGNPLADERSRTVIGVGLSIVVGR
jgi:hypothetical protein